MPLNSDRRKAIAQLVPEGALVSRRWLLNNGFDRHAIDNLVKSNQLTVVSYGIYHRGKLSYSWEEVVYELQIYDSYDCVIGGLNALELQGLAHYLPLSKKNRLVHLYMSKTLPKWVINFSPNLIFVRHNTSDIFKGLKQDNIRFFTTARKWRDNLDNLIISSPERAMLEALLEVPDKLSFDHANELMQGMTTFSPRKVQEILERCTNIKCK